MQTSDAVERLDTGSTEDQLQVVIHNQRYAFALERLTAQDLVLEVGTGMGSCSSLLVRQCHAYTGLEFEPEACESTRRRLNGSGTVIQGDAQAMPFADGSFSAVVCLETLEHLPDYRKAVAEIHRCLKPEGKAVISVPYRKHSVKKPVNPYHLYEPGEAELVGEFRRFFRNVEPWYQYFEETPLMTFARTFHIRRFLGLSQIYRDYSQGKPEATAKIKVTTKFGGMGISLLMMASGRIAQPAVDT